MKTQSNVVKKWEIAVESLESTNLLSLFEKLALSHQIYLAPHKDLVCVQGQKKFDVTAPIFQKKDNKIGWFRVVIVFDQKKKQANRESFCT